ncbi:type VII secretion integral membrane protein EccD [Streptomyces lydicus]|uniref:type VII secretion integral membrane protein EccD n=2 Tax=Streptomyces lydicus TaxID=47763 RepID=UPI00379B1584
MPDSPEGSEMDARMVSGNSGEMCRLVVVAPGGRQAEVAVPAAVPLCDLLPPLLKHAGSDLADAGLEHGGWVLQRLGETPLDEDRTPASLGLRDGDVVNLRPRDEALPEMDFDDLVDGISTGIRARPDRWRRGMTRRLMLGFMLAALAGGWALLLIPGREGPRAAAAGALAVLLVAASGLVSRPLEDPTAGILLGLAALPYAGLLGILAANERHSAGLTSHQLLFAGLAVFSAAGAGVLLHQTARPLFAGATGLGAAAIVGALPALGALNGDEAAAILLTVALALGPTVPLLAFRMARLRTTALPTGADDLGDEIDPVPAEPLLRQVAVTDRFMTSLFVTLGVVCCVCFVQIHHARGWVSATFTTAACCALLLRSRVLLGTWQRMAAILPAVLGLLLNVVGLAASLSLAQRLSWALGGMVIVAVLCLVGARRIPFMRPLPYWGRAADVSETLVALSVIPLLLQVLGVYGALYRLVS